MPPTLEDQIKVLKLQEIDNTIVGLTNKLKALPEAAIHRELEIQFNTARDLRVAAETELKDIAVELKRAEADVEQVEAREAKDEARLNAGQGSPKDLEQIQHELGSLKKRREELEEIELEVMMRADGLKARIENLKEQETLLAEKVNNAANHRDVAIAVSNEDLEKNKSVRADLVYQIDKTLIEIYEKQINNGRIGAAKLEHGECKGCNLAINPVDLKKINDLPADQIARCEECRCILVRA